MLCVDEKSQIQATHDYKRAGTSSLYATLDITTDKVIGRLHSRHRAIEFKQFLATLDREIPAELTVPPRP